MDGTFLKRSALAAFLPLTICMLFITACASTPRPASLPGSTTVVLVPDRDGHVGEVVVTSPAGSATLSRAGESVAVTGAASSLQQGWIMDQSGIRKEFGVALAAEPLPVAVYILYFPRNSSELDERSAAKLDGILQEIHRRDSRDISINGHTDTRGSTEYNLLLSNRRASKVRDILLRSGVKPAYISVSNHGKGNPLIPTGDNVDEPRNRRVEIVVR